MNKGIKIYKKVKMLHKQNEKIINRNKIEKWKNPYTIEEYLNAVAYNYNPKIKNFELFF